MLTPTICSSALSLHAFVFTILSNILSAAVCVWSIIFFKQCNIADRVCMTESLILLWQTMSLCLLLWTTAAVMQKAVFVIPSSLYVISCVVLQKNLNSLWIETVILTVITLILSVWNPFRLFPLFPFLSGNNPAQVHTSSTHLNHPSPRRTAGSQGTPAAQWSCLHEAPGDASTEAYTSVKGESAVNWSASVTQSEFS